MEDMCREFFLGNRESIKIKKEAVAVKNLMKIFNAALTISNVKGFAAMSLRELSSEAGLSMGALYTSSMETKNLAKGKHRSAIEAELFSEKILIDIMKDGQDKGVFKSVNTQLTGAVIKAMLQDWYLKRWKYAWRRVTVDKYAAFLVDLVETCLAPPQL